MNKSFKYNNEQRKLDSKVYVYYVRDFIYNIKTAKAHVCCSSSGLRDLCLARAEVMVESEETLGSAPAIP